MKNIQLEENLNLQQARDAKGKRIENTLIRLPRSKDDSKFPSKLGAVYHSKDKRRLRGLWFHVHGGTFVAQFGSNPPIRIKLHATTLRQAIDEHQEIRIKHRGGEIMTPKRAPGFTAFATDYMNTLKAEGHKKPSTIVSECCHIKWWCDYLNNIPLNKLTLPRIKSGFTKLKLEGPKGHRLSDRTLNYYLTAINCVLNEAVDLKLIKINPTKISSENKKRLWRKLPKSTRPLFTELEKESLCAAAINHCPRNGRQLADLINLLCYCGARVGVALRLRWSDVDWQNRLLTLARDGNAKSNSSRTLQFNPDLETLLRNMYERRGDDGWIFPSGKRGNNGAAAKTFYPALRKAREKAGLGRKREEDKGQKAVFHDCRHYFASMCVMAGVDFRTIAEWLGHDDGGVLVGSTYSHLCDEHKRRVADNLKLSTKTINGGRKAA